MVMTIKNPYNLIEKANETFNLYLSKYDEIEKYMISSKEEQFEIKRIINSFLEIYDVHQNKLTNINYKFLELFQNLIDEVDDNQKLIKNLESQIKILNKNNKNILNLVVDSNIKLDENKEIIGYVKSIYFAYIFNMCDVIFGAYSIADPFFYMLTLFSTYNHYIIYNSYFK